MRVMVVTVQQHSEQCTATTTETAKKSLSSIHAATFFHNCNNFSTVLYMGNNFHNNFFGKIDVKIFVGVRGP